MEYISKERLVELRNKLPESLVKSFVELLIIECKELPQDQWQTIEEFRANAVESYCFVKQIDDKPIMGYFCDNLFFDNELYTVIEDADITHIMPIKTPEAPK